MRRYIHTLSPSCAIDIIAPPLMVPARTRTEDRARTYLTHFRRIWKAYREHIFTFFSSHDQFNESPSFKCTITSLSLSSFSFYNSRFFWRLFSSRVIFSTLSPRSSSSISLHSFTTLALHFPSSASICPFWSPHFTCALALSHCHLVLCISFARKQCCGRPRAYALFSLNKFNLNFPCRSGNVY